LGSTDGGSAYIQQTNLTSSGALSLTQGHIYLISSGTAGDVSATSDIYIQQSGFTASSISLSDAIYITAGDEISVGGSVYIDQANLNSNNVTISNNEISLKGSSITIGDNISVNAEISVGGVSSGFATFIGNSIDLTATGGAESNISFAEAMLMITLTDTNLIATAFTDLVYIANTISISAQGALNADSIVLGTIDENNTTNLLIQSNAISISADSANLQNVEGIKILGVTPNITVGGADALGNSIQINVANDLFVDGVIYGVQTNTQAKVTNTDIYLTAGGSIELNDLYNVSVGAQGAGSLTLSGNDIYLTAGGDITIDDLSNIINGSRQTPAIGVNNNITLGASGDILIDDLNIEGTASVYLSAEDILIESVRAKNADQSFFMSGNLIDVDAMFVDADNALIDLAFLGDSPPATVIRFDNIDLSELDFTSGSDSFTIDVGSLGITSEAQLSVNFNDANDTFTILDNIDGLDLSITLTSVNATNLNVYSFDVVQDALIFQFLQPPGPV
jgi:hypothetical protein